MSNTDYTKWTIYPHKYYSMTRWLVIQILAISKFSPLPRIYL